MRYKYSWSVILFMRKKGMKIPQVLKEEEAMLDEALNLRNEKERKKLIKNIGEW